MGIASSSRRGGPAASDAASSGNLHSNTIEEMELINASDFDCQDKEVGAEDRLCLVDGADDKVAVPVAAKQTRRKTARRGWQKYLLTLTLMPPTECTSFCTSGSKNGSCVPFITPDLL